MMSCIPIARVTKWTGQWCAAPVDMRGFGGLFLVWIFYQANKGAIFWLPDNRQHFFVCQHWQRRSFQSFTEVDNGLMLLCENCFESHFTCTTLNHKLESHFTRTTLNHNMLRAVRQAHGRWYDEGILLLVECMLPLLDYSVGIFLWLRLWLVGLRCCRGGRYIFYSGWQAHGCLALLWPWWGAGQATIACALPEFIRIPSVIIFPKYLTCWTPNWYFGFLTNNRWDYKIVNMVC